KTKRQHARFGQDSIRALQREVPSPARLVIPEKPFLRARRDALDAELAPRQLTPPTVLPGKEVRPGERAAEGTEEPCDVVGLDATQAGVMHVGRVVARRREAVQPRDYAAEQFARCDR